MTDEIPAVPVQEAIAAAANGEYLLDVREQREWDEGHIPGSVFRPYHDLRELPGELDPERPVAVICMSGQRSAVGASLVQRHGATDVLHVVDGGVGTWRERGWPVEP
jgi:hydroxyacylglutathione hydrolase